MSARDHVFVNYAVEDSALADWFARRLAAAGYAVWYDRFKLLGGEPWPQDIEKAIEERTFRMLSLISRHSKDKKNPTGERKKGESVGQQQKIPDFVIPLNVDLATSEVPWDIMGTQYIDFSHSWATGLAGVLTKLEKVQCPRVLVDGSELVRRTVIEDSALRAQPETLSTNCFRVLALPEEIVRCTFRDEISSTGTETMKEHWAFRRTSDNVTLSFSEPPSAAVGSNRVESVERIKWRGIPDVVGIPMRDLIVNLLHALIDLRLKYAGFIRDEHGWHLPHNFRPKQRILFELIEGGSSWLLASGQRGFGHGKFRKPYRYHLGTTIRVLRGDGLDELFVLVKVRVHLTTVTGETYGRRGGVARRKHLCKNWWNNHWLSRTLAIAQILWTAPGVIDLGGVRIDGWPLLLESPIRIDETEAELPDEATLNKAGAQDHEDGDE